MSLGRRCQRESNSGSGFLPGGRGARLLHGCPVTVAVDPSTLVSPCYARWAYLVGEQVSRGCALPRASRSLGRGLLSPVAVEVERRGRPLSSLAVGGPVLHSVSSSTCPPSRRCLVASDPRGNRQ